MKYNAIQSIEIKTFSTEHTYRFLEQTANEYCLHKGKHFSCPCC